MPVADQLVQEIGDFFLVITASDILLDRHVV